MANRLSQDIFIARAEEVWGDRYDLSEVKYESRRRKIKVRCLEHGVFYPSAGNFLEGHGCPACGREETKKARVKDSPYFIEKAREIHGDKYDYSHVHYTNNRKRVEIICPIHGSFFQKPNDHLCGKGCIKCAGVNRMTTNEFVDKAKTIHRGEYDYSLVEYCGSKKKVAIICKTHGVFYQTPNSHLDGKGCPICQETQGEKAVRRYLEDKGVAFEREKRFFGCKDIRQLRFDFCLTEHNACIEFQGKQHYKEEPFFNSAGGFEGRKRRDNIKRTFCKEHGITLIEIGYNENVSNKLDSFFRV